MRHTNFYLKKRQLKAFAEKLQRLYLSRSEEAQDQIEKLIHKIKSLVRELSHVLSHGDLKKILGAAAILIGISFPTKSSAQLFAAPVQNPFGLVSTNYLAFPAFADLDNDGDLDLLVGENYGVTKYFENIGSGNAPQFAAPLLNPFGIKPNGTFAMPTFADLDGDGDMDIMLGEYLGSIKYYQNIGTPSDPEFATPILNPFGLGSSNTLSVPAFADLDGDGDLDLLLGETYGPMKYYENTGTISSPQFELQPIAPNGLGMSFYLAFPAFADLDRDGDIDLLVGEYYGAMQYFENIGSALNPQFAPPQLNPFGLVSTYYNAFPAFADLDGDGDTDLLVGEYYGAMQYFEHVSVAVPKVSPKFDLKLYPNPVSNLLKIDSDETIDRIEIFNALGKNVLSVYYNVSQISLNNLSPGTYMVKVTSAKGHFTTRMIQKQ